MNDAYRDFLAAAGASVISHIGLVDVHGRELSGGDPPYRRRPVTWTDPVDGLIQLESDLIFHVPAGTQIAEWRGYSAETGGTDYDGAPLPIERFTRQGQYILLASGTGIMHSTGNVAVDA